jgi:superkiller protein 3
MRCMMLIQNRIFPLIVLGGMALVRWGSASPLPSEPEGKSQVRSSGIQDGEEAWDGSAIQPTTQLSAVREKPVFSDAVRELFVEFGINQGGSEMPAGPVKEDKARQAQARAYQHYMRGAWLFESGRYKEALDDFEQASSDAPDSLHIRYSIATCYFRLGELDQVIVACDAILKKSPGDSDALILKAETFAAMDNYRKAQELYEQVLKTEPANVEALEALGKIYFKVQGNLDKTIEVYEKILSVHPRDLYSLVVLASVYALKGEVDKSLSYYDRILQQQPTLLDKLIQMGELLEEHQQYEGALKVYRQGIIYDPKNLLAVHNFEGLTTKLKGPEGLLAEYKALAEEYPAIVDIRELYARQLIEMGRYEEAREQLKVVESLSPEQARVHIALAKVALAQGKEKEAEAALAEAVKLTQNKADVYTELGLFCQKRKDYAHAASYFEKAIALAPHNLALIMSLLRTYDELKAYDKKEALIKQSIAENEKSDQLYALLGEFYQDQNRTHDAIEAYQKAVALKPAELAYVAALGEVYLQDDRVEELDAFLQEQSPHFEKDAKKFDILAASLYNDYGKFSRAVPYLQKALEIDPTDLTVYGYLSWAYNRLHQYDQALEILEKAKSALGEKAQSVEYDMLLASTYTDQKKYDQAVERYEKVLARSPSNIDAYRSITFCLNKQGKYKEALEYVEKAEQAIGKEKSEVAELRAQTLADQKQYEAAAAIYKGLIAQDKTNDHYYFMLGEVYYEAKQFADAEAAFRKAIELNENNVDAYNNLGYMFAENNMSLDEAQKLIEKALELHPNAGYIIDSLGWVYFKKGEIEKAIKTLEKAEALSTDDPAMFDHLGDAYRAKGETQKALTCYKQALALDPSMIEVQKKIDELKK